MTKPAIRRSRPVMLKDFVKVRVSPLADLLGLYDMLFHRTVFARPGWLILMYHRVIDNPALDPFRLGMCVGRENFRAQIEFLDSNFSIITVEDGMRRLARGEPLPPKALSITFDDGYRDFVHNAVPILREYDCPASMYVAVGGVETNRAFWWDRVIDAFARTRHLTLNWQAAGLSEHKRRLSLAPRRRRASLIRTLERCWQEPAGSLEARVEAIRRELGINDESPLLAPRMNESELASLDPRLVELGAHCVSHTDLTRLAPDRAQREMIASRRRLQKVTGRTIVGLAYPGGRQDRTTRTLAQAAGFDYALGTEKGLNRGRMDPFNLQRIGMPDTPVADLKRSLSFAARHHGDWTAEHPTS